MSGLGWNYSLLASALEFDGPIFGIQTMALDEELPLPQTIDDLAREYVHQLRTRAPHGPCHLLGWSLGGVLAHSMAVQLQLCGYEVATLTLLDSHLRTDPAGIARDLADEFASLGVTFEYWTDPEKLPLQTSQALRRLARSHGIELTKVQVGRMFNMAARAASMINVHTPGIYRGDALFFSASAERADPHEVVGQWVEHISGTIRHRPVSVPHNELTGASAVASISTPLSDWLNSGRSLHNRARNDLAHSMISSSP